MASITGYVGSGYGVKPKPKPKVKLPPKPPPPPSVVPPPPTVNAPSNLSIAPNYGSLITSDPRYTGPASLYQNNLDRSGNTRREQIRQALLRYGGGNVRDTYGDLDPATLQAAKDNPHSVFAELLNTYKHNTLTGHNRLEERGILNSGATNEYDQQLGRDYSKQNYDATQSLQDLIDQAVGGYAGAQDTYNQNIGGLYSSVGDTLSQDPTITSAQAHLVQGSQGLYGQAIYADAAGNLYTQDGKPYVPVTVAPPTPQLAGPDYPTAKLGKGPVL